MERSVGYSDEYECRETSAIECQASQTTRSGVLGGLGQTMRDETALSRISAHAGTAQRVADLIQGFIDRCRGGSCGADASAKVAPVPTSHFAQLERLEKNLAHAEELARELGSIG
jgi:hypothetical protein